MDYVKAVGYMLAVAFWIVAGLCFSALLIGLLGLGCAVIVAFGQYVIKLIVLSGVFT